MKGILEQPQEKVPTQARADEVSSGAERPAPDVAVNTKLQDELDAITANGVRTIHNKKVTDDLIKGITNAPDPVDAIAHATLTIIERVESSARQNNIMPDFESVAESVNILMGEIIQIVEIAGLPPLSDEDKYRAYSLAVSKYIGDAVESGKMSPEQLQQMAEEMKQTPEGQKIMQASGEVGMDSGVQNTGGIQPRSSSSAVPPPPQAATGVMPTGGMPQRRM